jgi:hypothetical protein
MVTTSPTFTIPMQPASVGDAQPAVRRWLDADPMCHCQHPAGYQATLGYVVGARVWRTARGFFCVTLLLAGLAACGSSGDLTFTNEGTEAVTVTTDHDKFKLPPNSGTSILDNGCNKGNVTVTFASGSAVTIPGPVCPDKQVVIRNGKVDLKSV